MVNTSLMVGMATANTYHMTKNHVVTMKFCVELIWSSLYTSTSNVSFAGKNVTGPAMNMKIKPKKAIFKIKLSKLISRIFRFSFSNSK